MKKNLYFIFLILILTQPFQKIFASDKNRIIISGEMISYFPDEREKIIGVNGYYEPYYNPAIEIMYQNKLFKKGFLGIGVNYHSAKFGARRHFVGRFTLCEISIPIVFSYPFLPGNNKFMLNIGMSNGLLLDYSVQQMGSSSWYEIGEKYLENNNEIFFTDLYIDISYNFISTKYGAFEISPLLKYRVNATWLNHYSRNIYAGIKLKNMFSY